MFRGPAYAAPPATIVRWMQSSGAGTLAVDLDEIKKWVNRPIEDTVFDNELTSIAMGAQRAIERYCQLQLTFGTWVGTAPCLTDRIRLLRRPFVDCTAFEYVATDGTITTMDAETYHVLPVDRQAGMMFLGDNLTWPAIARRQDAVRLTVRAGFSTVNAEIALGAPELPEDIRRALLLTIASMDASHGDESAQARMSVFAMRQGSGAGIIPRTAISLLAPYVYRQVVVA